MRIRRRPPQTPDPPPPPNPLRPEGRRGLHQDGDPPPPPPPPPPPDPQPSNPPHQLAAAAPTQPQGPKSEEEGAELLDLEKPWQEEDAAAQVDSNKRVQVKGKATTTGIALGNGDANGKKRRSPAVLMEGSRCSRVNGRGWRCCQQTLVGYSLCEHHLGKGRLRSVSSVKGGAQPRKREEEGAQGRSNGIDLLVMASVQQEEGGFGMEEEDAKKGRKKIGVVKARSINSLLDERSEQAQSL